MSEAQVSEALIRLEDYQPTEFATRSTDLWFDIHDGYTLVESRQRIARRNPGGQGELCLDGQNLELLEVAVDGRVLAGNEYQVDSTSLVLPGLPDSCEVSIRTRIVPETNTALEGLYKSGSMYCTQCEAEGFRKITYYQDRPDVLSVFTTKVTANAASYPVLLANGNLTEDSEAQGRRTVTWHDPHPKPSYLFALVAGDLAMREDSFTTASNRTVTLQIYSEPHNIDQCAYAMDALKRSMRWDEQTYGREYDLDIFMIVAVDDFNMGAMENKGLNIFNTSCVLATPDTATDLAYQRVETVVAHEYFHNWSGNRVTCRDWFQLSLKEGFTVFRDAQFSADMNSATAKRIEDVNRLRSIQFAEDSGPLAHAVRPRSYLEISNFYTPTIYEKGAEVVRMLHTCTGPDSFRRGSDLYFEQHDGSAATTEDFVQAMESASGRDFRRFRQWYEQAGTPELDVQSQFKNGQLLLTINQHTPPTPGQPNKEPTHIPLVMGLLSSDGQPIDGQELHIQSSAEVEARADNLVVHLLESRTTIEIGGLTSEPSVSFLRGFSAPVRVNWDRPGAALRFLAEHDPDGFARWDAMQSLLVGEVKRLSAGWAEHGQQPLEDNLMPLFARLLQQAVALENESAESLSLLAEMLTIPSELYLFEQVEVIDVEALCAARDSLQEQLAQGLLPQWQALYHRYRPSGRYSPVAVDMAQRRLANLALGYLCAAGGDMSELVLTHYQSADNLTDRRAALVEISNASWMPADVRSQTLSDFYDRWQHEALVVNQWLTVMASSRLADAEQVAELENHAGFDKRNPNKVRSLIYMFAQGNQRNFHAADGSGYTYLANKVLELNATNPQIASNLCQPLTRWRRYAAKRGRQMQLELQRIAAAPNLSKDVFEKVTKALA